MAAHRVDAVTAMRWLADRHGHWPPLDRAAPPPAPPPAVRPIECVVDYVRRAAVLLWTPAGEPQRRLAGQARARRGGVAGRTGSEPTRAGAGCRAPRRVSVGRPAVVYPALTPARHGRLLPGPLPRPAGRQRQVRQPGRAVTRPTLGWPGSPRRRTRPRCAGGVRRRRRRPGRRPGRVDVRRGAWRRQSPTAAGRRAEGDDRRIAGAHRSATVVVCFDADPAGRAGAARLASLLSQRDVATRRVSPPDGQSI